MCHHNEHAINKTQRGNVSGERFKTGNCREVEIEIESSCARGRKSAELQTLKAMTENTTAKYIRGTSLQKKHPLWLIITYTIDLVHYPQIDALL